jgi:hypothetical protein
MSARGKFERYALLLHRPWSWNRDAGRPDFNFCKNEDGTVLMPVSKSECVFEFDNYIKVLQKNSCTPSPPSDFAYTQATRDRNRLAWITTLASGIAPDDKGP